MGLGALMANKKIMQCSVVSLLYVEILLTLIGGFSLVLLHGIEIFTVTKTIFSFLTHALIILVGILTGLEIPLLMDIRKKDKRMSENTVLAFDYLGAFLGTVIFAFVFYPRIGLLPTAFICGALNALAGMLLISQKQKVALSVKKSFWGGLAFEGVLFVSLVMCVGLCGVINENLITLYLR